MYSVALAKSGGLSSQQAWLLGGLQKKTVGLGSTFLGQVDVHCFSHFFLPSCSQKHFFQRAGYSGVSCMVVFELLNTSSLQSIKKAFEFRHGICFEKSLGVILDPLVLRRRPVSFLQVTSRHQDIK